MICSVCHDSTLAKLLDKHRTQECPDREVHCRVPGCLKVMKLSERYEHERHTCRFRLVTCKQGCGESCQVIRVGYHMANNCTMRYIECPLKCGTKMRQKYLDDHIEYDCMRRHQLKTLAYNSPTGYSLTLTHSLTYLLTHLLTHSLTYLLTHSLTYSLIHLLTHSFTYLLTHLLR